MSREIKFRAINGSFKKEWVYGYYLFGCKYPETMDRHWIGGNDVYENTLGQYTGIKDRKDKEIYEGDILKISMGHPDWTSVNHEVLFENSAFCIRPQTTYKVTSFILYMDQMEVNRGHRNISQFIEVIGNIHENPELLK